MMNPMTHAPSSSSNGDSSSSNNNGNNSRSPDEKILSDLKTVFEQMDLCTEMLVRHGGIVDKNSTNDALLGVIGFLEACAPRMVELVEAGAQGAFQEEETLMKCLEANDKLLKMLTSLRKGKVDIKEAATSVAAAKSNLDIDLDDLLLDDVDDSRKEQINANTVSRPLKTDVFDTDEVLQPTPYISDSKKPAAEAKRDDPFDDFDAFLNERTAVSKLP